MNERIQELAKEAGYVYHVGGTVPHFEFSNNQLKKFAELIVQDCVDILAGYRGKVTWKNEEEIHQHPILVIQKHFGVEE